MDQRDPHPLWRYLPADQRTPGNRRRLQRQRLWAWMQDRRQRISLLLMLYIFLWMLPLLWGQVLISLFALLPLLLVPPLGWLVYWLVWKDFHG